MKYPMTKGQIEELIDKVNDTQGKLDIVFDAIKNLQTNADLTIIRNKLDEILIKVDAIGRA